MTEDDPDYARCFTVTGRPRRDVIRDHVTTGRAPAAPTPPHEEKV